MKSALFYKIKKLKIIILLISLFLIKIKKLKKLLFDITIYEIIMASQQKNPIISVGFHINVPQYGIEYIMTLCDVSDGYDIPSVVSCGVLYDKKCKGGLGDVFATQEEMELWYSKKKGKKYSTGISTLYVFDKPQLIVAQIQIGNECVFAFLSNTHNVSTTQFKKVIVRNTEPLPFKKVVLPEPVLIDISVYKHLNDKHLNDKHQKK